MPQQPAGSRPTGNRIDGVWPAAPAASGHGALPVGATTLVLDRGPRPLTIELWYPAAPGTQPGGSYATLLRDGVTPITLHGRAARDARPGPGSSPLVILSHGYPGNRLLLSHFGETLASRGFIVASADHPQSTYADRGAFADTLLNRPLDQLSVLAQLMDHAFWGDHLQPRAAVIGYSMGAYGAMLAGGAGLSAQALTREDAPPGLARFRAGSASLRSLGDPRLKAVVPIGLWGGQHGFWDRETLAAWALPCLLIGGSADAISGWDPGIFGTFRSLKGRDQWLLEFSGAGHNAAAPIPAPEESWAPSPALDFLPAEHYADPVWPTVQMNAAAQAVVATFLTQHLKSGAPLAQDHPVNAPWARALPQGFTGPEWENLSLTRAG